MQLNRYRPQRKYGVLIIALGFVAVTLAILITPTFATNYLSRDHNLTPDGIKQLNSYRLILSLGGILLIISGSILTTVKNLGEKFQSTNNNLDHLLRSKVLKWVLIFFVLCFSLLRFVNLNADFPSGITKSAELYTDEGWYSAAAVRHVLTGQWYLAGDVNTAVLLPVGQILHRISFALFGLGLSSARATVVVSFILLMVLTALLVRRSFGDYAAMLTTLLLTSNYVGFAYSRLALMYLVTTFFIVASLFVAGGFKGRSGLPRLLVAALVLGAGILTNTIAVLAVPLLAFLAWRSGSTPKERIVFLIASGLVLLIFVGGYLVVTNIMFPEEYTHFNRAMSGQTFTNIQDWFTNLSGAIVLIESLGTGFVRLTVLFTVFALLVSKRFRRDPLVHIFVGYIVVYMVMLSLNSYRPVRYYLPLLVPLAGLCATACIILIEKLRETRWSAAAIMPVLLVAAISLGGGRQIITYLSKPSFSFYQMAHGVGNIIQEREGTVRGVLLFGDIADSVSLEIGTNAVNSLLDTSNVDMKLRQYHPKYMIVHTSNIVEIAISEGGEVIELGAWNVFGNYYANGEQVRLYFVQWPGESGKWPKLHRQ